MARTHRAAPVAVDRQPLRRRWRGWRGLVAISLLLFASLCHGAMVNFGVGTYIIPMDTGTNGQDNGMLRAYGLVHALLRGGVPVHWAINPSKGANGDDFSVSGTSSLIDVRTGASITSPRSYRGGPFLIAAADAPAALPIITAWQATSGDATSVHRLASVPGGVLSVNVSRLLVRAPRIAVLKDGNETIAFNNLNAAGITDSIGGTWTSSSPDLLTEADVAGISASTHDDGVLFHATTHQTRYCELNSMHYNTTSTTPEVIQEVRSWLDRGPQTLVHLQCESSRVFESGVGGQYLTVNGLDDDGAATNVPNIRVPSDPLVQIDATLQIDSGAVDSMHGITGPGQQYKTGVTTLINDNASPLTERISLMTGRLDGVVDNGRVVELAGHDYALDLPISVNPQTNGVRVFLNSTLDADCAVDSGDADMAFTVTAPALIGSNSTPNDRITYTLTYSNPVGVRPAENLRLVDTLPVGTTYVSGSASVAPSSISANRLTWLLPPLQPGSNATITFQVMATIDGTYSNSALLDYSNLTVRRLNAAPAVTTRDTLPPTVNITAGPNAATNDTTPTFDFTTGGGAVLTRCRIDADPLVACSGSFTAAALGDGNHTFEVQATDAAGNVGAATRNFTVDTVPPTVTIDTGATGPTNDTTPSFTFTTGGTPLTTQCAIDNVNYVDCASGNYTSVALADGAHIFTVRVVDAATNAGNATRSFSIDTVPPQMTQVTSAAKADWSVQGATGIASAVSEVLVGFGEAMRTSGSGSVLDAANWRLVGAGNDGIINSTGCAALLGDDIAYSLATLRYDAATRFAAIAPNSNLALQAGKYRLFACAALADVAGNALSGGADVTRDFTLLSSPRILNPNFDSGLSGWSASGPLPLPWSFSGIDGEGQPLSGAALLATSNGAGATWRLEQCVPLAGSQPFALNALLRIASATPGAPVVVASAAWRDAAGCSGTLLRTDTSNTRSGDSAGAWQTLSFPIAPAPANAASFLLSFEIAGNAATIFSAEIDRVFYGPTDLIFRDNFEAP